MSDDQTKVPVSARARTSSMPATLRDWDPFANLHREFNDLFTALRGNFPSTADTPGQFHAPAIDIAEKQGVYELTAELPGMSANEVEVAIADGRLTIKGEKREERKEEKEGYHLSERRFGSFQRSFTLPEGVDTTKISADFKDGVLTVSLPKAPEAQRRQQKIEIKSRG
jgi:HSP20 family protein